VNARSLAIDTSPDALKATGTSKLACSDPKVAMSVPESANVRFPVAPMVKEL